MITSHRALGFALLMFSCLATACQAQANQPAAATGSAGAGAQQPAPEPLTVYVGTYTNDKTQSKGIYKLSFDPATGALGKPEVAAEARNPSFLAISPDRKYLYAVGEMDDVDGTKAGAVSSFGIDAQTGTLSLISQAGSGGKGPCHVSVDATGRNVLVANYGGGTIARLVSGDGGKLLGPMAVIEFEGEGPSKPRQDKPHAHFISPDPANAFVMATDLGTDQIYIYQLDPLKGLVPNETPTANVKPGSGPRHLAFHPRGKFVYSINELSNTITAFAYDTVAGTLSEVQTITTLPEGETGPNTTAQIVVHPSGKYVYGSNRGHNSIVAYAVDEATGKLTLIGQTVTGGKTPRNFNIDPGGGYLIAANQNSGTLVVLKIDPATGALAPTGVTAEVPSPVCVTFLTSAK